MQTESPISLLSLYAKNRLERCDGSSGTVHSVYRKTINLTTSDGLIAIQASGSPLSPLSLISALSAQQLETLPIASGDRVAFHHGGFSIRGRSGLCRFSFVDAQTCDLRLSAPLAPAECQRLANQIEKALLHMETEGFRRLFVGEQRERSLILTAADSRIAQCSALLNRGAYRAAADTLAALTGLGIGLTPSGDDFLCGVLAGLFYAGKDDHPFAQALQEDIRARLSDTIDISAAFLSCALDHQFSLAANQLRALPSPQKIAACFSEIGHSSGTDTLCGVLYALRMELRV